jgi:hypothetical protein
MEAHHAEKKNFIDIDHIITDCCTGRMRRREQHTSHRYKFRFDWRRWNRRDRIFWRIGKLWRIRRFAYRNVIMGGSDNKH